MILNKKIKKYEVLVISEPTKTTKERYFQINVNGEVYHGFLPVSCDDKLEE